MPFERMDREEQKIVVEDAFLQMRREFNNTANNELSQTLHLIGRNGDLR